MDEKGNTPTILGKRLRAYPELREAYEKITRK
jgi:hypothetical protein